MLTLGSPKRDAEHVAPILRRAAHHAALSVSLSRYERDIRRRLRSLLRDMIAGSDLYEPEVRRHLSEAQDPLEQFGALPLLDKPQLRAMVDRVRGRRQGSQWFTAETSGSTGVPLKMLFGPEHFVSYYARFLHLLRRHSVDPIPGSTSMVTVSVFPHCVDYYLIQPAANNSFYHRININELYWKSPRDAVECIARENPAVLRGMPSSLEKLADIVEQHPLGEPIRPKLVVTFAETLLPSARDRLQQVFTAPVMDEYGLTEIGGMVAQECSQQCGFHLIPMDYFVEVVDERGAPVEDGVEGEIVITNLYNKVVPVLRYRTADYGVLSREPCACGCALPRIARLTGRALTRFLAPGGKTYNPFDAVGRYLLRLPVNQFQLVQQSPSRIVLRYDSERDIDGLEDVEAVAAGLKRIHGCEMQFELVRVDRFTHSGKFQAFLREELLESERAQNAA